MRNIEIELADNSISLGKQPIERESEIEPFIESGASTSGTQEIKNTGYKLNYFDSALVSQYEHTIEISKLKEVITTLQKQQEELHVLLDREENTILSVQSSHKDKDKEIEIKQFTKSEALLMMLTAISSPFFLVGVLGMTANYVRNDTTISKRASEIFSVLGGLGVLNAIYIAIKIKYRRENDLKNKLQKFTSDVSMDKKASSNLYGHQLISKELELAHKEMSSSYKDSNKQVTKIYNGMRKDIKITL